MKIRILPFGIAAILGLSLFSCTQEVKLDEKTVVLQPGADKGKDANIHSLNSSTSGSYPDLMANAWTWNAQEGTMRILIEFNLDTVPANAIVEEAKLTLYAATNQAERHSQMSGSNEAVIQFIFSEWDENTVTWETQPLTSEDFQVILPASNTDSEVSVNDPAKDYIDVDIRTLVQFMVMNKEFCHGFMIKLKEETPYRRLSFASSDNADATKHPKLVVKYLY